MASLLLFSSLLFMCALYFVLIHNHYTHHRFESIFFLAMILISELFFFVIFFKELINKKLIHCNQTGLLTIKASPFPFFENKTLQTCKINQLSVKMLKKKSRVIYNLYHENEILVKNFDTYEKAKFVERLLEEHLSIKDKPKNT